MDIRTVGIIGAGAIGSYIIWGLADKLGDDLIVIADGERKERLSGDGLNINGRHFDLNVKTPDEAWGVDMIIVCVKYGALDDAAGMTQRASDEHTIVMSLMNGIDSEKRIGELVGMEHLLYSVIKIASHRGPDGISFAPPAGKMGIYFGENKDNGSSDLLNQKDMVRAVSEVLDGTPVVYHISENIMTDIWAKFAMNVSENLPQAIIGCGMGGYYDSTYVDDIRTKLREEVLALAGHEGIEVPLDMTMTRAGSSVKKDVKFSTLQDIEAGRHTEVDMLAGEVIRLGREFGIPTPYNEIVYDFVKALEEKNDGKFDY